MFTENIYIFTEDIYAIMNPEFPNSQEHKCCCCDVTYGYLMNLHSEVALKVKTHYSEQAQFLQLLNFP